MTLDDIKARVAEADRMAKAEAGRGMTVLPNGTVRFDYRPIPKRMAKRMRLSMRKAIS